MSCTCIIEIALKYPFIFLKKFENRLRNEVPNMAVSKASILFFKYDESDLV